MVNTEGASAWECVYWLKTAWQKWHCELAHCLDAESTFLLPQIWPFLPHLFSQLGQDLYVVLLVNRLTLRYSHSIMIMLLMLKTTINIAFSFDLLIRLFSFSAKWESSSALIASSFLDCTKCFITCDDVFQQVRLLFSSFHVRANVSPVVFLFLSGVFGDHFRRLLFTFNQSCNICLTVSLSVFTISVIIRMLRHQSFQIISLIFSMCTSVIEMTGRPGCSSSSTFSRPSLNLLCRSKTWHDMILVYTSFNSRKLSVRDFFSLTRNMRLTHCSHSELGVIPARQHTTVCFKQCPRANWMEQSQN